MFKNLFKKKVTVQSVITQQSKVSNMFEDQYNRVLAEFQGAAK